MSEEVIKDMIEKLVSRVYELDLEVIESLVDIELYSSCSGARWHLFWGIRNLNWDEVKKAYVPCAVAMIIHEVWDAKFHEKPITDFDKVKFMQYFTLVLSPAEYDKVAKDVLEGLERSISIARLGIIKKKYS
jgi:hypothetical protein